MHNINIGDLMKTIIINASPRKEWTTSEILKSAQKGAESVGSETELLICMI